MMAEFDPMAVLAANLPSKSGQAAYQKAAQSTGLGAAQNVWQPFQTQAPQQLPQASAPSQQPAAPAPQPAVAGAVSEFEGRLEAARPAGWPAVQNVFSDQLGSLWMEGVNKDAYDSLFRRYVAEEQTAAQAVAEPPVAPVV